MTARDRVGKVVERVLRWIVFHLPRRLNAWLACVPSPWDSHGHRLFERIVCRPFGHQWAMLTDDIAMCSACTFHLYERDYSLLELRYDVFDSDRDAYDYARKIRWSA